MISGASVCAISLGMIGWMALSEVCAVYRLIGIALSRSNHQNLTIQWSVIANVLHFLLLMLSVEVYSAKQKLAVNIFSSQLGQNKVSCSDIIEIRGNHSCADEKTVTEHICKGSNLDDKPSLHSPPIQCYSPNIDGELVIVTSQPFRWSCSSHSTIICKFCRGELARCDHKEHIRQCSEFVMGCVFGHGECRAPCTTMKPCHQKSLVTKRSHPTAFQDDCTFDVNCIAVQESIVT